MHDNVRCIFLSKCQRTRDCLNMSRSILDLFWRWTLASLFINVTNKAWRMFSRNFDRWQCLSYIQLWRNLSTWTILNCDWIPCRIHDFHNWYHSCYLLSKCKLVIHVSFREVNSWFQVVFYFNINTRGQMHLDHHRSVIYITNDSWVTTTNHWYKLVCLLA